MNIAVLSYEKCGKLLNYDNQYTVGYSEEDCIVLGPIKFNKILYCDPCCQPTDVSSWKNVSPIKSSIETDDKPDTALLC